MLYSRRLICALFYGVLIAVPRPAFACFVCDEVVELDQVRAACFLEDFETYIEAIDSSRDGRAEVDLTSCANAVASGARGIDAMPKFLDNNDNAADFSINASLRSVYILDADGATCLKMLLDKLEAPIDPSISLDLVALCQ